MKKLFLVALIGILSALTYAENLADKAMFVYRSDGMINTLMYDEIDSITYSFYDLDSILHEDIVTQIIYTPDTAYFLLIDNVDSISFRPIETKYRPNVIVIDDNIKNYIKSVDSLTIYFLPETPTSILPKKGDKLLEIEITPQFPHGFMGEVESVTDKVDSIAIICSALGYEDVFESFCYISEQTIPSQNDQVPARNKSLSSSGADGYSPGTFSIPMNSVIAQLLRASVKKGAFSGSSDCKAEVTPTFWTRGSLIVHPIKGIVVSVDVKTQIDMVEYLALYGTIDAPAEIPLPAIEIPTPILAVGVYGVVGLLLKAEADITSKNTWKQRMSFNTHYEYMYNPLIFLNWSTASVSDYSVMNITNSSSGMIKGSLSVGPFVEIGIEVLNRKFAATALRGECGFSFSGNYVIGETEARNAGKSTALYNVLKNSYVNVEKFVNFKALARAFKFEVSYQIDPISATWPLYTKKIVPTFYNTSLTRKQDNSELEARVGISADTFLPTQPGFRLYQGDPNEGIIIAPSSISLLNNGDFVGEYSGINPMKSYTVYPTVDLMGIEMLAEPAASTPAMSIVGKWVLHREGDMYSRNVELYEGGTGRYDGNNAVRWTFDGKNLHLEIDMTIRFSSGSEYLGSITFPNYYVYDGVLNNDGTFSGTGIGHTCYGWNDGQGEWCDECNLTFTMKRW